MLSWEGCSVHILRRSILRRQEAAPSVPASPSYHRADYSKQQCSRKALLQLTSLALISWPCAAHGKRWQRGKTIRSLDGRTVQVKDAIQNSGVAEALDQLPERWPFTRDDFKRWNEEDDAKGFLEPSFERHIDSSALSALEHLYAELLAVSPAGSRVLDLCASWDSHLPQGLEPSRVAVLGMNREELVINKSATDIHIRDLNRDPHLPFADAEFDVVTMALSVQYLARPREVFEEMHRVLRRGGVSVVAFSSRSFPWKVVSVWSKSFHDGPKQCKTVGTYFKFSPAGGWSEIVPLDISPHKSNILGSDELWAVVARKL